MKIAITGKICSGKSTLAEKLKTELKLEKHSFGNNVKKYAKELFNMEYKDRKLIQDFAEKLKEIDNDIWIKQLDKEIKETKESNLSANVGKLDVLPNPSVVTEMDITNELITQQGEGAEANFRDNFRIYTFKDTNLLDYLKNLKILGSSGRLSHPLPIKYSFTIFGTSGIRRGDMFNIVGIPEKYRKSGLFQVNAVSHTIEGMSWKTNVEGLYRQSQ